MYMALHPTPPYHPQPKVNFHFRETQITFKFYLQTNIKIKDNNNDQNNNNNNNNNDQAKQYWEVIFFHKRTGEYFPSLSYYGLSQNSGLNLLMHLMILNELHLPHQID